MSAMTSLTSSPKPEAGQSFRTLPEGGVPHFDLDKAYQPIRHQADSVFCLGKDCNFVLLYRNGIIGDRGFVLCELPIPSG